jgi:hypothetical protein
MTRGYTMDLPRRPCAEPLPRHIFRRVRISLGHNELHGAMRERLWTSKGQPRPRSNDYRTEGPSRISPVTPAYRIRYSAAVIVRPAVCRRSYM